MLKDKKAQVKIVNANVKYYHSKGYTCKQGDLIAVNINDLPLKSDTEYVRTCDCCGKEYSKPHSKHIRTYNSFGKDVCPECYKTNTAIQSIRKEHWKQTLIDNYGVSNPMKSTEILEKQKQTNLERYGTENVLSNKEVSEKRKKTLLDRYGVENPVQNPEVLDKIKTTMLEKYGHDNPGSVPEFRKKAEQTMQEVYGCDNPIHSPELKEKAKQTNLERYGVPYFCMDEKCHKAKGVSIPNKTFGELLTSNDISYKTELTIGNYIYDFSVDNTSILLEIDPSPTHNTTWNPYGKQFDSFYHSNKTKVAADNNYRCIHIFDWDDQDKVINLIKRTINPETVYARQCIIKEVDIKEAKTFLNQYHLQGYAKDEIRIGLYHENDLVSIMTWGKPRYSKSYDYELIRYASSKNIIGGAEKLFKHFLKLYEPNSLVSYCDLSKFDGYTYTKLGFTLSSRSKIQPSKHWYNIKTHKHITDNLLRQRGFDQLLGKEYGTYGKGTSNEELMREHGFVEVYDCGQATFFWRKDLTSAKKESTI